MDNGTIVLLVISLATLGCVFVIARAADKINNRLDELEQQIDELWKGKTPR